MKKFFSAKLLKILLALVFLLVLISLGSLVFFSYNSYPNFVPISWQAAADSTIVKASFLPKTSRQILVASLAKTRDLSTYSINATVSIKTSSQELAFVGLKGQIEQADSFSSKYLAELSTARDTSANANFAEEGTNLYLKVASPLVLPGLVIPKAKNTWYKIDLSSLNENLGVKTREDDAIVTDVGNRVILNWNFLREAVANDFSETSLNNRGVYKITLKLDKKTFDSLVNDQASFDNPKFVFWVDKENLILDQFTFTGDFVSPYDQKKNTLELNYALSSKTSPVQIPAEKAEIKNPVELWTDLNLEDGDTSSEALFQAAQNSPAFGQNFVTLERILKVIFLLPKSL